MMPTQMILVRILVAKVENTEKLAQILRQIPVRQGQEGWNCVSWVQEAFSELEKSKSVVGTSVVGWKAVRDAAMDTFSGRRPRVALMARANSTTHTCRPSI